MSGENRSLQILTVNVLKHWELYLQICLLRLCIWPILCVCVYLWIGGIWIETYDWFRVCMYVCMALWIPDIWLISCLCVDLWIWGIWTETYDWFPLCVCVYSWILGIWTETLLCCSFSGNKEFQCIFSCGFFVFFFFCFSSYRVTLVGLKLTLAVETKVPSNRVALPALVSRLLGLLTGKHHQAKQFVHYFF